MIKKQMTADRLEEDVVILQDLSENNLTVPRSLFTDAPREGTVYSVEMDENGILLSVKALPEETQRKRASIREKLQLLRMRSKNRK